MTENRRGIIGVGRTIRKEFVLLPIPDEDIVKSKAERVIPQKTWRVFVPGMLSSISEGLKPEDTDPHDDSQSFVNALIRAGQAEYGFHIEKAQVLGKPRFLKRVVEQQRNGQNVPFDTWFVNLLLQPSHFERIEGAVVHSPLEMLLYLNENKANIRPSTEATMREIIKQGPLF